MQSSLRALAVSPLLSAALLAQTTVIPNGFAAVEGSSSTAYPWQRTTAAVRVQYCYDSSNFTAQSLGFPMTISRVKWRANGGTATTGGTYSNVAIDLSTATVDHLALSTTFATNHGADRLNVYTGSVTVAPTTTATPNNYYVDVPLTTPFFYDPNAGDLLFDISFPAATWTGGTAGAVDVEFTVNARCSRMYNLTSNVATTGTFQANVGPVIEISYAGVPGAATVTRSGTGCTGSPVNAVSFYENFPAPSTFDLSNTGMTMTPAGSGYLVQAGASAFVAPAVPGLALTDDSVSVAQNLGFTLSYPGGSTTQVRIGSNGYIFLNGTSTLVDLSPTPAELLTLGPRVCPHWTDLLPDGATNLNNVFFETDVVNNLARVTWLNVPEFGNTGSSNTCQVVFHASGVVEIVWLNCANISHPSIVGFSPGSANRDPGNRDLSATMPFTTAADSLPPLTQDSQRPIIGTTINLTVGNIPAGSLVGLEMIGPSVPGIDLTGAGLPTCFLYVVPILAAIPFGTGGSTAITPLSLPNDPSLVGGQAPVQAVVVAPGINPFGALTSNLATLTFGTL